ncbi:MAG: class I SAM-dependent methyltransferase [Candidatus Levybacteria bacterium]|nr:class I SAM-dependent methyltransferase [Candidatus Levybacteria bacterium]
MEKTDNFRKHTSQNPLQKFLIDNFYKNLISVIKDLKINSVLDVGCGEGFTLNKLYENKIGKKLEGVDFLETAIELGKKTHPHLILNQGDIYKLKYQDNAFDLVMATEVLEHLEDPRKGLKELIRVSKKYILLSVPNEPFFMGANFLRGKNITRLGNDIEHIHHWTAKRFEQFTTNNSQSTIKKVRHPFPWTILLLES